MLETHDLHLEIAAAKDRMAEQRGTIRDLTTALENRNGALAQIADMPFTMVNDADSLRHMIKTMQNIAMVALDSVCGVGGSP